MTSLDVLLWMLKSVLQAYVNTDSRENLDIQMVL